MSCISPVSADHAKQLKSDNWKALFILWTVNHYSQSKINKTKTASPLCWNNQSLTDSTKIHHHEFWDAKVCLQVISWSTVCLNDYPQFTNASLSPPSLFSFTTATVSNSQHIFTYHYWGEHNSEKGSHLHFPVHCLNMRVFGPCGCWTGEQAGSSWLPRCGCMLPWHGDVHSTLLSRIYTTLHAKIFINLISGFTLNQFMII